MSMKITICGSMYHKADMLKTAKQLEEMGYEVETPDLREGQVDYATLSDNKRAELKDDLIKQHLEKMRTSDAILVFNEDKKGVANYIGGNTLMEMAFAYAQEIEIFLFKPAPDMSYKDEILGMKPIVLDGDIQALDAYFQQLPTTFISSKSPIKQRAVSRGLRRAGIRTRIVIKPTQSDVAEQPLSIEETYEGAQNRHAALVREMAGEKADYLVTVESGTHVAHPDHNAFSCTVVVLEKVGTPCKVGLNLDLEFPKEMTDKVPSQYPDLGVLVQQEYGATLKDPIPYFTNGKISRMKVIEDAVFNVAVQL